MKLTNNLQNDNTNADESTMKKTFLCAAVGIAIS